MLRSGALEHRIRGTDVTDMGDHQLFDPRLYGGKPEITRAGVGEEAEHTRAEVKAWAETISRGRLAID